jgi:hypothetical protein
MRGKYLIAGDCLDSYDNWYWNGCEPIPSHDERVLETRVFG